MIDATLKNATILIVDDQEVNIQVLGGLLARLGYINVISVVDPREVFPICSGLLPDLILLDLSMPYLSGFEVMEQLKQLVPTGGHLPVLVLTADNTPETKQRVLSAGVGDFLSKPFDLTEVGLRIRNLLFISYLRLQLQHQNQKLEEKVKIRTAELEVINHDLVIAKEKAEASDLLKTAFLRNISHEIRTPLNGILGFGARLAGQDLSPEKKALYLAIVQSSSDRLSGTVSDFLDIEQIVSGTLMPQYSNFSPEKLLTTIYNKFRESCQTGNLAFYTNLPLLDDNFQINSDPVLLQKVLSHLVVNAIKFTLKGTVSFGVEIKGGFLEFFVQDTGVGVNEAMQESIFDYFMQEDVSSNRSYEGNGLGLYISKRIVEILGGQIWLQSVKGEGSIFYFSIPYTPVV